MDKKKGLAELSRMTQEYGGYDLELKQIWTVGHSNRSIQDFLDLAICHGVTTIADIRSYPTSSKYPHFNRESLGDSLAKAGIKYVHLPQLGGRRGVQPDVDRTLNVGWTNPSFRNYADYTLSDSFKAGLDDLIKLGLESNTAYMCSEAVPWRCHRTILSDVFHGRGWRIYHILDKSVTVSHLAGKWGATPLFGDKGTPIYPGENLDLFSSLTFT